MRNKSNNFKYRFLIAALGIFSIASVALFADLSGARAQKNTRAVERSTSAMDKVSHDLRDKMNYASISGEPVKVIIQRTGPKSPELNALIRQNGVRIKGDFDKLNAIAVELPVSVVDQLAMMDDVVSVVYDTPINALGHVNTTTGADAVRAQTNATGGTYTLNGTGIGIAVIDSGIYSGHKSLLNAAGATRLKYSKDFTGEGLVSDPFGHGTHVATAAMGYRVAGTSGANYEGVAWNANLINLRVLNSQGTGTSSALLGALNWILTNRATYNIRVVNISLGMPAINSYTVDPVCLAVRSLVDAGVVVVAAAGNDGKSVAGQKQYGTIHSPGNEPSAITVGASNSFGTDVRSDDNVTTYSSRGPTRSYKTDIVGIKHYDNIVKPDLVAPGNKLIYGEADSNLIITTYPDLDAIWSQRPGYRFQYMSGSSMSTPIVAGAAALILQANPNLRPNMVKMILTYTAQQLAGYNTLEQGAGQLNIEGAIRLANAIKTTLPSGTALGTSMLVSSAPTAQSTVAGTTFPWAGGMMLDHSYGRGTDLITKYQKIYDLGVLVGDGTTINTSGVLVGDLTKVTNGVLVGDSVRTSNGVLVGDGTFFMSTSLFLGNGVLIGDGVLVGDGVLISDGVLVGDGVLIGDTIDPQGVLINGDNTAFMR